MDYKGEMRRYKRSAGLGGFAKALSKLKIKRSKTDLEELIAELGYRIRVGTKIRQYVESVMQ